MATTQSSVEQEHLRQASSDEIRDDIRGTRRHMDETLDQLGERLHPRHLLDDVLDLFRSSGGDSGRGMGRNVARGTSRAGRTIAEQVREHPLPAVLIGAGLVWWMLDRDGGRSPYDGIRRGERGFRAYPEGDEFDYDPDDEGYDPRYAAGYAVDPAVGPYPGDPGTAGPGLQSSGSALGVAIETGASAQERGDEGGKGMGDRAREAAGRAGSQLSGVVAKAGESGRRAGESASAGMRRAGRQLHRGQVMARDRAWQAKGRIEEACDDHPLAMGGLCLAAGIFAGLLLPRTDQEDRVMGEQAEHFKTDLQEKGKQAVAEGREAAARTAGAALDKAEEEGVTPAGIASKLGKVAAEAVEAGKESAQREGVTPDQLGEKARAVKDAAKDEAKSQTKK